jgi:mono/diheme cytochrome c family protein
MTRQICVLLILLGAFPLIAGAQQAGQDKPLSNTQKLGQRIFQQRCGVCHSQLSAALPMYGPSLYKDLVNGNEEAIRQIISEGSGRMPGFRFGLQPPEIDAIVEYLKTVPKPAKASGPSGGSQSPVD